MFSKMIIASGAVALVAAVPMAKRDIVWVTHTDVNIVTVPITTTVFVEPTAAAHYGHNHGGNGRKSTVTSSVQSTITVTSAEESTVASSTAEAQSTSAAVSVASVASVAPIATSTSVYVAPTTSTSVYVAPTTSTSVWVAPTTSTSVYVAPTTSTSVWVAPTSTLVTVASTTSSAAAATSTAASGATHSGDITYYDVGLGSCGWTNSDSEAIVAMPHVLMNNPANPNNNPWCGKYITISYAGATHQAKIVDTCMGCDGDAIDLSPTLFAAVAPSGNGRVHDVEWWFT